MNCSYSYPLFCFLIALIASLELHAQRLVTNGSAFEASELTYLMTQEINWESSSIWNQLEIDLREDFTVSGTLNLGDKDANGADGIVFVLQNNCTNAGTDGGGIGYDGMTGQSFAVEFDTWSNGEYGDPYFDHVGMLSGGSSHHAAQTSYGEPVTILDGQDNAEDGAYHDFRMVWQANSNTFSVFVDGNLRLSETVDLVNDVFAGDPFTFWGFTAATGGSNNEQWITIDAQRGFSLYDRYLCPGGSISFTLPDLSSGETVLWSPADGVDDPTSPSPTFSPASTTTYTMTRTDACGNELEDEFTITVGDPVVTVVGNEVSCSYNDTGHVYAVVDGGERPYTYSWDGAVAVSDSNYVGLQPGAYDVVVTDANGCEAIGSGDVGLIPVLEIAVTGTNPVCPEDLTGTASVEVTGGYPPFAYQWSSGANTPTANGLTGGTEAVNVTDSRGCEGVGAVNLVAPNKFIVSVTPTHIYCDGDPIGEMDVFGSGGTAPYTFEWSNGATGTHADGFYSGVHSVTMIDSNGCTTTASDTVKSFAYMIADFSFEQQLRPDGLNVAFTDLSPSNVDTYEWDFGDGNTSTEQSPTHTYTKSGEYEVNFLVTGGDNCAALTGTVLVVPLLGIVWLPNAFSPNGDGLNDNWVPEGSMLEEGAVDFKIYNRWGDLIYESVDAAQGWDGRVQNTGETAQPDVYTYHLRSISDLGDKRFFGKVSLVH